MLLDALADGDLIYLAADEPGGRELFRAVQAGAPEAVVVFVPPSDSLPGEASAPTPANAGERTAALRRIHATTADGQRPRIALISTGEAAARLTAPAEAFGTAPPILRCGQELNLEQLAEQLCEIGYFVDDRVDEPGEIGPRGQVLDIFPADAGQPYRVEVQEGRLAAIRAYDPATQLTTGECETLEVGRVTEPAIGEGMTLLDHLPAARVALAAEADGRRQRFLALAEDAARRRPKRALRDICEDERWQAALKVHESLELAAPFGEAPPRFVEGRAPERAFLKAARAALATGDRVLLLGTARDLRFVLPRAARALKTEAVAATSWAEARATEPGSLISLEMPVPRGFRLPGLLAVAAADLLGSRAQRDTDPAVSVEVPLLEASEVRIGDVVVHEDHGIAIVAGLQTLPDDGGEAIVLRFAGDARRLVPVTEADRLWRYGADEDAVTLDKLDGSSWEKRRLEILSSIAETARGLVALAAERMKQSAPVLEPDAAVYERFASGFPFTETADQARAIEAVRADLSSGKPMDRLIIGDVGYGKTEVALRAAAIAALAGKQVAVAAPTTVLARQHLESFRERFAGLDVEVAGLSRLASAAERKRVAAGLKDGSIRVVVGTGAVAGKAIAYADLALVVIDEEQRFGAADKTKLRELSAGHVLTLSATPIPRTLQSALIGLQQMSVIATPPARRQPIRTAIASFDEATVRTALLREKSRGGQSFVVVPKIEDMTDMAARLARIAPELDLLQAHGKMPAGEIDETMVRFAAGDGDVLLATNIIEAGLDVPRANTMLVWRADRFGLSQLHQLRGRVGRGARRGQIYLLTEEGAEIAPRTMARLNTLQAFDRLGAGFAISARDLDQRGAGDLLSDEQSGHVKLIGVDLYQNLLGRALREARGEAVDEWTPTLNLGTSGSLPAEWIPEEETRVGLYIRFARLADVPALEAFEQELADRFGELPPPAQALLALARARVLARSAGIDKVDAGPAAIALTPRAGTKLGELPGGLDSKDGRLLLKERIDDPVDRLVRVEEVLAEIS
ncbi:helicase-related protein [Sphingomonas sp. BN140010]|uniref:Transcription-repair-coupling factor n=1 Tax=Sphingomonas arvum TaxID=2992113 RepID=A0ABT3JH85_9SPHN|nr:helicase-related protein [Sphingomonas sp. BN140010]